MESTIDRLDSARLHIIQGKYTQLLRTPVSFKKISFATYEKLRQNFMKALYANRKVKAKFYEGIICK